MTSYINSLNVIVVDQSDGQESSWTYWIILCFLKLLAAHCFWNDAVELLPASNYVVGVGKLYRPYNDPRDRNSQQSNVVDIKISSYFRGATANYQNDIAVVVIETPFVFHLSVRPVCLNFDYHLDRTQLAEGNSSIAAGWTTAGKNSQPSQVLKVANVPYINLKHCYDASPTYFREYLTNDKFCVGSANVSWLIFGNVDAENFENSTRDQEANYCFLPPYPEHGRYTVKNYPNAIPGESYPRVALDLSWDKGYKDENIIKCIFCVNGYWSATMSTCSSYCTLNDDLSLEYRCVLSGSGSLKDSRQCESLVPAGTVVTPICRAPDFYSLKALSKMYCRDGIWDYKPICKPACGIISPQLNDTSNNQVDLPWHAGIYRKLSDPYLQICAGSLIKANTVISAAHCFWNLRTHLSPPSDYVVTVGKLYRLYNDPRDKNSQQSDVVDIKIPSRFKGEGLYNQNDIALLFVKTPFIFHMSVRPVCLDFDYNLDRSQLTDGKMGKAAGWSITHNNIQASPVLNVADIPYINIIVCNNNSPIYFQPYITSDKFCAGSDNGTAFCREDIGGGLAFLESTTQRYYLRGVFSGGLIDEDACSSFNLYTSIVEHENFIKQYL